LVKRHHQPQTISLQNGKKFKLQSHCLTNFPFNRSRPTHLVHCKN
jgi:hypothetical protein